jgi:peptide/nickel transport system ATP-binding protein
VFITHDLGVIADIADRVLVMYKGEIVEEGAVEQIFKSPKHPYTKSLLACRPPLGDRLRRLPVVADFMEVVKNDDGTTRIVEKADNVGQLLTEMKIPQSEIQTRLSDLMKNEPILRVENLKTWFPSKRNFFGKPIEFVKAVDDVSFDVYPGETLGLVGESGCGKTTLGRTILRLSPATEGAIFFENNDLTKLDADKLKALRRDIQIIFQDPYSSLNPRMTIGSAIMEPMQVHNLYKNDTERKEKVIELLETVSLDANHFNRYPHEFSGGQRQRICIARALALNPKFIICDESVSALDVSVQAQVLNLLIELRQKMQFTCIFISHDLSVVKFISDRMVVMNKGKIEEMGVADEIYNNPQKEYTKRLIAAIPKGL